MAASSQLKYSILIEATNKASAALRGVEQQLGKIGSSIRKFNNETQTGTTRASSGFQKFGRELDRVRNKYDGINKAANGLISIGFQVAAAGAAVAASFSFPVSKAAEFERAMNGVLAVTSGASGSYQDLSNKAQELGRNTKFTASEAADAMRFLGMAGLDAQQVIEGIGATLELAAAGNLDLARAADIATNVMTGFNLKASELARVSDIMAKTAASANTNIEEMGEAMSYAAPVAAAAGVELEEAASIIGVLADAGIKASRGGTTLRGMLARLSKPTEEARATLSELGVEIQLNSKGNVDLTATLEQLESAQWKLSDAVKIFGRLQASGAIATAKNTEKVRLLTAANKEAAGAAKEMAETMKRGLAGAFIELKSATEGLLISLGKPFLGTLESIVDGISSAVRSIADWVDSHQTLTKIIGSTLAVFASLITSLGAIATAVGLALKAGTSLIVLLESLGAVAAGTASAGLAAVLSALGPIVVAVAAVSAAIGVLVYAFEDEDKALKESADSFKEYASAARAAQKTIDEYERKVKDLDSTSTEYLNTNKILRKSLVGISEKNNELSVYADAAAASIDSVTGSINDGGAAINRFKEISLAKELINISNVSEVLEERFNNLENIDSFDQLSRTVSNYKGVLDDTQKKNKEVFSELRDQGSKTVKKLLELNKIDYRNTVDEIRQIAVAEGVVKDSTGPASDAVANAFKKMQKISRESSRAIVENAIRIKEGYNIDGAVSDYEKGLNSIAALSLNYQDIIKGRTSNFTSDEVAQYMQMYENLSDQGRQYFITSLNEQNKFIDHIKNAGYSAAKQEELIAEAKVKAIIDTENKLRKAQLKQYSQSSKDHISILTKYADSESAIIQRQLNEQKITTKQANEAIASIEITKYENIRAVRQQYLDWLEANGDTESDVYKKAAEEVKAAAEDVEQAKKDAYKRAHDYILNRIQESEQREKQFRDTVRDAQNEIYNIRSSFSDKIRDIRRRNMTEAEQQNDIELQANEKLAEAHKLLAAGELERAQAAANSAGQLFSQLKNESSAISGLRQAEDQLIAVQEKRKSEAKSGVEKEIALQKSLRDELSKLPEAIDRLTIAIKAMQEQGNKKILPHVVDQPALDAVTRIQDKFNQYKSEFMQPLTMDINTINAAQGQQQLLQRSQQVRKSIELPMSPVVDTTQSSAAITSINQLFNFTRSLGQKPIQSSVDTAQAQDAYNQLNTLAAQTQQTIQAPTVANVTTTLASNAINGLGILWQGAKNIIASPTSPTIETSSALSKFTSMVTSIKSTANLLLSNIPVGFQADADKVSELENTTTSLSEPIDKNINTVVSGSADAENMFDMLQRTGEKLIEAKVSGAQAAESLFNRLTSPDRKVITIVTRRVSEGGQTGGLVSDSGILKLSRGGKLPGYGGGDKIKAVLEQGEWVIRKEAVSKYGSGLFAALNSMVVPLKNSMNAVKMQMGGIVPFDPTINTPKFRTGGAVGGAPSINVNYPITINAAVKDLSGGSTVQSFSNTIIPQIKEALRNNTRSLTTEIKKYVR